MALQIPEQGEFRKWLEDRRGQVVGEAHSAESCPIAHWLCDVTGEPVGVTMVYGIIDMNGPRGASLLPTHRWPDWLADFVEGVDLYSPNGEGDCEAEWCLDLLDELKAE